MQQRMCIYSLSKIQARDKRRKGGFTKWTNANTIAKTDTNYRELYAWIERLCLTYMFMVNHIKRCVSLPITSSQTAVVPPNYSTSLRVKRIDCNPIHAHSATSASRAVDTLSGVWRCSQSHLFLFFALGAQRHHCAIVVVVSDDAVFSRRFE